MAKTLCKIGEDPDFPGFLKGEGINGEHITTSIIDLYKNNFMKPDSKEKVPNIIICGLTTEEYERFKKDYNVEEK